MLLCGIFYDNLFQITGHTDLPNSEGKNMGKSHNLEMGIKNGKVETSCQELQ